MLFSAYDAHSLYCPGIILQTQALFIAVFLVSDISLCLLIRGSADTANLNIWSTETQTNLAMAK